MNRDHLLTAGHDPALEGRINSFELAFRMQSVMPEVQDLGPRNGSHAQTVRH